MKFMTVCARGEGLPIAMKLQDEGFASKLFSLQNPGVGEGLVEVVKIQDNGSVEKQIMKNATKDTMIVFTRGEFGPIAEKLQGMGYLTFGASSFHASLQQNAGYVNAINSLYGIQSVPDDLNSLCVLEAWFSGEDFIYPIFGLFHEYGFMPGDVGPVTECAGVTGFAFKNFRPPKFQATLEKLKPALKKVDYRGPISVDLIGNAVMRYVCGMRFDFMYLFMQLIEQPLGKLLIDVARGMIKGLRVRFDYGMCVRATMPPYPHGTVIPNPLSIASVADLKEGLIPIGLSKQEDRLVTSSQSGEAFCVCGFGATVKDAQANTFQRIGKLIVPNLQFRIDIGAMALKNIGQLLQSDSSREDHNASLPRDGAKDAVSESRGSNVLPA